MKLLIKIYSNDSSILEKFNSKISEKNKTTVVYEYLENANIPKLMNSNVNSYDWDIILPIYNSYVPIVDDFDKIIKKFYEEEYPKFDGVIWLNDDEQDEICTIPVIGKKYYKKFGYIYNDIYNKKNFEKEFTDVLKLNDNYSYMDDILFKKMEFVSDDDKIYEFRKKLDFCLKIVDNDYIEFDKNSYFNKFVDEVYVINLKRRMDRFDHMIKEMNKLGVNFKRFNGVDGQKLKVENKGRIGCIRSHVGVIKDAIDKKYEKIAVFQDDVIFCDDFDERFEIYLRDVPDNWEIMYLGCHFNSCEMPKNVKNNIHKVNECYGCFAMILNNKNGLFQKILNNITEVMPFDNQIKELLPSINAYVFMPFFVKTLDTVSDISDRKESFSYDVVDKYFKNKLEKEDNKPSPPPPPRPIQQPTPMGIRIETMQTHSNQYMCEDYLRGDAPFLIYIGGRLLFDSQTSDKSNLNFYQDHFTLYGKVFPYQGMMIKRK